VRERGKKERERERERVGETDAFWVNSLENVKMKRDPRLFSIKLESTLGHSSKTTQLIKQHFFQKFVFSTRAFKLCWRGGMFSK
jgi:hypothetical protein